MTSEITRRRIQIARERIDQQTGEIPSSDGGGGTGGHSDRTGTLAFRHKINPANPEVGHMADVARRDSDEIDRLERSIMDRGRLGLTTAADVAKLDALLDRWAPLTQRMLDGLQGETADKGEDGCVSCARAVDSLGRKVWNQKHPRLDVCLNCHRLLLRIRARDGHNDADLVPLTVIAWRERHGKPISETVLDRLLTAAHA